MEFLQYFDITDYDMLIIGDYMHDEKRELYNNCEIDGSTCYTNYEWLKHYCEHAGDDTFIEILRSEFRPLYDLIFDLI